MGKNVLVLNGSPRTNGNTAALVDAFAEGAGQAGNDVVRFDVALMDIAPCRGCLGGGADAESPCVQKDDMDAVYAAYRAADGTTMTYGELWKLSDAIAATLAARTDDREPVVVLGHKAPLMVAGFLGCLKSGHAFVPVDTEMPVARLMDIVSQLGVPLLAATVPVPEALRGCVPVGRIVDVRAIASAPCPVRAPDRGRWVTGEQTQYLIFTSGSTGRPKGIEVSARNVARFMDWVRTFPVIGEGGRVFLDQPPYSFDLSEYEVVGALSTGGCLHAVEREERLSVDYAPVCGIVQRTLEPLSRGGYGGIHWKRNDKAGERAHPFAAHGIALVRHCRRTYLGFFKRLLYFLHILKYPYVV